MIELCALGHRERIAAEPVTGSDRSAIPARRRLMVEATTRASARPRSRQDREPCLSQIPLPQHRTRSPRGKAWSSRVPLDPQGRQSNLRAAKGSPASEPGLRTVNRAGRGADLRVAPQGGEAVEMFRLEPDRPIMAPFIDSLGSVDTASPTSEDDRGPDPRVSGPRDPQWSRTSHSRPAGRSRQPSSRRATARP